MLKASVFFLALGIYAAAPPPLVYQHSNGTGPGFPSKETVTVNADGSVVYELDGPISFDWSTQNRAGEFVTRVDATVYTKLARELMRAMPNGPRQKAVPPDSGIETIAIGATSLSRASGAPSAVFEALKKEIDSLAAAALPHPVRALELSCERQPETLLCRIVSVGTTPVAAPDLSVGNFFCFDRERHMQPLQRPAGLMQAQSGPPRIEKGQSIDLRFPPSACGFHLVVQTKGATLVSNPLSP